MATSNITAGINVAPLAHEAVALLRDYITIDTTNPPGDVSKAADWVEQLLQSEGFATTRVGPSDDKPNVIATLGDAAASDPSTSSGQAALVLAHHMDVVPAVREDWSVDPFGGSLHDGFVWGRGALDMKGFGVMTMLCAIALKRQNVPLRRPLRILASADEEVGGIDGAKWLAEHQLDAVRGAFLLTEGSFARAGPRATYYAVQVAEKGVSTVKLSARGQPGHASAPREDNAVIRIAGAIARIGAYRSPPKARELARRYLAAFPPQILRIRDGRTIDDLSDDDLEEMLLTLSGGSRIQNMLRNTFVPTMVHAGLGQNVIPPTCDAHVDVRTVPGVTSDDLLAELRDVVGDPEVELSLVKSSVGTDSPVDSELFDAIANAVHAERPDALIVPFLTSGGTDCKHFRPKGIVCYGNIPFELDDKEGEGIHGIDERVSVENIERGMRILFRTVVNMCAKEQ